MNFIKNTFFTKKDQSSRKLWLKLKITFFTFIAVCLFFATLFTLVYSLGRNLLIDKAVESQREIATTLASSINAAIERQAELLKLHMNNPLIIDTLKENNLKYQDKTEEETRRYLMDMDKRWIDMPNDHPFVKDYLESKISLKLRQLMQQQKTVDTILLTDRLGGLVASTIRPAGFYSFDQDWWLSSYAKGRGKLLITPVEYNEQNNVWCLPFVVPVEDEVGDVIGLGKIQVSLDTFFAPLLNFKLGNTGNAILADDKAYLLYHPQAAPFVNKFCEYEEFQKVLQNNMQWGMLDDVYLNTGVKLEAYSKVNIPSLLETQATSWYVFVGRDLSEILSPLNKLIFIMGCIGLLLTIILLLAVFILSGQESPYSILQVIKETEQSKQPDEAKNPAEERARPLPKEEEL